MLQMLSVPVVLVVSIVLVVLVVLIFLVLISSTIYLYHFRSTGVLFASFSPCVATLIYP